MKDIIAVIAFCAVTATCMASSALVYQNTHKVGQADNYFIEKLNIERY